MTDAEDCPDRSSCDRERCFEPWRASHLAIGVGSGAELRRPLGVAIVGGLIFSQVLTLYTTPVIYLYLDRLRLWFLRLRGFQEQGHPMPLPA